MNILLLPSATCQGRIAMTYCNISLGFTNIKRTSPPPTKGTAGSWSLIPAAAGYVRWCHDIHAQTLQFLLLSPAREASGVSQCDDGLAVKEVADICLLKFLWTCSAQQLAGLRLIPCWKWSSISSLLRPQMLEKKFHDASPSSSHDHPMPVDPSLLLLVHSSRILSGVSQIWNRIERDERTEMFEALAQVAAATASHTNGLPAVSKCEKLHCMDASCKVTSYPSYGLAGCVIDESHTIWASKSWKLRVNKTSHWHWRLIRLACANE